MRQRADIILIGALEFLDIIPESIAKMLVKLYDQPVPINYDTAYDLFAEALGQLISEIDLVEDQEDGDPTLDKMRDTPVSWESCVHCQAAVAAINVAMNSFHQAGHE